MATHDYVIANGTGAAVRSDLNGALAAIVSNNSSATQPATMYAYQWWADTTTGLLKIRNSANSAWVTLFELDGTLVASDISLGAGTVGAPSLFFTGDSNTGLFSPGADTLALVTGGTNRVHVTSGGLVGIGTTPAYKLDVAGTVNVVNGSDGRINLGATTNYLYGDSAGNLIAGNSGGERVQIDASGRLLVGTSTQRGPSYLQIEGNTSEGATGGSSIRLRRGTATPANGENLGTVVFADNTTGDGAYIQGQRDAGTWSATSLPTRLVFSTSRDGTSSPTEKMRITSGDSNGAQFLFNCTSFPSSSVKGTGLAPNGSQGNYFGCGTSSTSTFSHFEFHNPNGTVGSIATNASATAYNTSSDYRLKENIVQIPDAIDRLQQLKPSRFNFIVDPDKIVDGFIAHEAQAVVPECVTGTKDAVDEDGKPVMQGIDQSKLVPLLTAALQEAIAEINALKDRVVALEAA